MSGTWVRYCVTASFCSLVLVVYAHAQQNRERMISELEFRVSEMEKQKLAALIQQEDLSLTLASQSDPSWIELVLLRELGVVPEGFLKVYFKK